jgi:hypothetical protein
MFTITAQHEKLLDAAEAIRLDPDKIEAAFMARQLVQATLPHSDPKDVPEWTRTNGNLTLSIVAGRTKDAKTGERKSAGYPYGTIPRLLLFWMTTEAVRTKNRRLFLGNNLTKFMRDIGLNPDNGGTGAKRSDARRLRDQMERLFKASISFEQTHEGANGRKGESWMNMNVASKAMFWWDEKQPEQPVLFESWIELGEDFFEAITAAPVPVNMIALKALKGSALALDLYAWASYTAYQTQQKGQSRFLSWELLHNQIGGDYSDIKEFGRKSRDALRKVKTVYPALGMTFEKGGVRILPCSPSVTVKKKSFKNQSI